MLKFFTILAAVALCTSMLQAAPSARWGEVPSLWGKERMSFRRHAFLNSDKNFYRIDFLQWQATGKNPSRIDMMLTEPLKEWNFSRPVNFFELTVNGISLANLEPAADDFTVSQQPNAAICTMKLDFDGATVALDWYMTDGSPLLFCRLRKVAGEFKSIKIKFQASPSKYIIRDGKTVYSGIYHRQAVTPVKTYQMANGRQKMSELDRYIIFQDAELQPGKGGGAGPCALLLDNRNVKDMWLTMRNSWVCDIQLELKPDASAFNFALYQSKSNPTNAECAALIAQCNMQYLPK